MRGLAVKQALGQFIGDPCRGAFFGLGVGEDFGQARADVRQVRGDGRQFGAAVLEGDVDQATGVDHIVRGVEDAAPFQLVGDLQVGQLRTGGTGHGGATQLADAVAIEHGAKAAGREDVAGGAEQGVIGDRVCAELLHGQLHFALVDVADQQFGAGGMQLFGEGVTDVAQALDRHAQAFEIVAAQARHRGGADTGEYAHGGMGRRVAGGGGAGDEAGLLGNAIHVGHRGAAVDGGDIAAIKLLDTSPEGFKQGRAAFHMGGAQDHGATTAYRQTRQGGLVAHALGQACGVGHRAFVVGICEVTTTTQGRPQAAVVDGYDRLQPGRRVDA